MITPEKIIAVMHDLRHCRAHKLLSSDWPPVEAAENLLLELAEAVAAQPLVLELPDAEGYWWGWDHEGLGGFWELVYVQLEKTETGTRPLWRNCIVEDFNDEPCTPGRWVRVLPPAPPGGP